MEGVSTKNVMHWRSVPCGLSEYPFLQVKLFELLSAIMSSITDVRCILTHEALDDFCNTFPIPEEVHPILPNQVDTMHERPVEKIRLYTRFFDFANFRLPLSTFLVDILRYFQINVSQLSIIGAAKVDDFAYPASFPWHTAMHMIRDPAPATADFNAQDYATLVAHPSSFQKFPAAFQCLVRLSRHYTLDEETYCNDPLRKEDRYILSMAFHQSIFKRA
nr:hypothetical protein [Tanacetum cinerariifolium]